MAVKHSHYLIADKIDLLQHHEYLHLMRMERAWRIFTCICVDYLGMSLPSQVEPLVGYKVEFCQDNESMSSYGVMRGLHFQRPPFTLSKLVRCVKGSVTTSITLRLMGVSRYWMNRFRWLIAI